MEIYFKLFEVLFPVFFIVAIGYFLGKKNSNFDTSFITNYSANFGAPALFVFAITSSGVKFDIFAEYFIYSIIALTSFAVVGLIFLSLMNKDYIRELPPFFFLTLEIWVYLYVFLHMGLWVWALQQLFRHW